VTRDGVRRAFRSALERARDWQLADVAVPPLGLGAGNLELEVSAEVMAHELVRHIRMANFPKNVTLVAETADEASALEHAMARSGD
jgi:O-acetyl-ADP-ribose deacetylase (regulator of RNase III)